MTNVLVILEKNINTVAFYIYNEYLCLMSIIKESVKAVIANKENYNNVQTFARTAFLKFNRDTPLNKDMWRTYYNFQVWEDTHIRINYTYGFTYDHVEHQGCIFIDIDTNEITETYNKK